MKTWVLAVMIVMASIVCGYGQGTDSFRTISGKVVDSQEGTPLAFVSVAVPGRNIATITNMDGEFSLKVPSGPDFKEVLFSYIGYAYLRMSPDDFKEGRRMTIELKRATLVLPEVIVKQTEAEALMREVVRRIPENYSAVPNQMVGFYREMIRKNSTYVSLVEAVLDIYKAPYRSSGVDMARIYKGRRSVDREKLDTVLFKYQGGVAAALELDLAKNYDLILSVDFPEYYRFYVEGFSMIDDRSCYVVAFKQREDVREPLFFGKFYIDAKSLAIARIEFSLNVEDQEKATAVFLKKKPQGMKVNVQEANYLVQFRQDGNRWYYQNFRVDIAFKCRWPRRWFNSVFRLQSELAVTDRGEEGAVKFSRKERLAPDAIIVERVSDFEDENFWESYNIIEPEQSIERAIHRLANKLKKRN